MDTEVEAASGDSAAAVLDGSAWRARVWRRRRATWMILGAAVVALSAVYVRAPRPPVRYLTAAVTTGSMSVTVTASGNLEPRNQVDLGSELSGTVRSVHADANEHVRLGQLLVVLDTTRLSAQQLQAESAVAAAEARVLQSDAALREAAARHARLLKVRELSANKLPSQQDLDLAEAAVARARGELAAVHAAVAQARAALETIKADLSKAEIRSPVDGIVLVRSVEPGQTVAAAFQAPVLFTLAQDLRQMELHVALDEADVGTVNVGQTASFSVDAFPDRLFDARVTRIHLASNNTRTSANSGLAQPDSAMSGDTTGVVTYETVLDVDNRDLLLRPGMTATAQIFTDQIDDATLVPNVALRFTPQQAEFPRANDSARATGMLALMPRLAERWRCPRENGQALACVWLLEKGEPVLALFRPGPTDGTRTQVANLDRLPNWSSLASLRNDPVLAQALKRKLVAGMPVIVGAQENDR